MHCQSVSLHAGKCGNDGFYYNDYNSFVICSNGNAYIQPCAPGSKNSGHDRFHYGSSYSYREFCDVNLVDDGYNLKYGYQGHGYESAPYGSHNAGYGYGYADGLATTLAMALVLDMDTVRVTSLTAMLLLAMAQNMTLVMAMVPMVTMMATEAMAMETTRMGKAIRGQNTRPTTPRFLTERLKYTF